MKKQYLLPLTAILGSVAAFALRFLQNRTGFEATTGLPIPGNFAGLSLIILLFVLAAGLLLLSRRLPEGNTIFPTLFSTSDAALLTLPVMGILLMGVSGALELASIPLGDTIPPHIAGGGLPVMVSISAATALLPAIALFPTIAACRLKEDTAPCNIDCQLLLVPPVCLVVRLVLTYRAVSIHPSLETYYVELLALIFLTLGFYRLASIAFQGNRLRQFSFYTGLAVILSITTLADGGQISSLLLYGGAALTLLGFQLLACTHSDEPA